MFPEDILACLKAPGAGDDTDLERVEGGLRCRQTGALFADVDGVPSLFNAAGGDSTGDGADITDRVKRFYEENPFPGYEGLEDFSNLVHKGFSNPFSRALLDGIGFNKSILDVGCGTGQLSHFLQLNNNRVLGIDMSLGSLKLALEHKRRNGLVRCGFAQMNIFDLAVKDASFDIVISHGVLHHTFDARRAFRAIARKVKPVGIVVVGLYNRYARIPSWVRGRLVGLFGNRLDYVVRNRIEDERKAQIWINDQYYNPHESWHSIDDVLLWFAENEVEFVNCTPGILGTDGEDAQSIFTSSSPGNRYQRIVTQLAWMASISREGGLFDVIGRKCR